MSAILWDSEMNKNVMTMDLQYHHFVIIVQIQLCLITLLYLDPVAMHIISCDMISTNYWLIYSLDFCLGVGPISLSPFPSQFKYDGKFIQLAMIKL